MSLFASLFVCERSLASRNPKHNPPPQPPIRLCVCAFDVRERVLVGRECAYAHCVTDGREPDRQR